MSKDRSLGELRRQFTVGELVRGEHDTSPSKATEPLGTEILSLNFLSTENPVDAARPRESVQQMVDRGVSRAEIMREGTLHILPPR